MAKHSYGVARFRIYAIRMSCLLYPKGCDCSGHHYRWALLDRASKGAAGITHYDSFDVTVARMNWLRTEEIAMGELLNFNNAVFQGSWI